MGAGNGRERGGSEASHWLPLSEEDRSAVREQLERILASPGFRNSRKYPAFLRYIVEHTLNGESDHLKERTLGVEVFGRPPEYDTSVDPVVRVVAAEVRNRIGRYYYESAAPGELLLDLHSGTYVPRFAIPDRTADPHSAAVSAMIEPVNTTESVADLPIVMRPARRVRSWRVNRRASHIGAVLSIILAVGATVWLNSRLSAGVGSTNQPAPAASGPIVTTLPVVEPTWPAGRAAIW